MTAGPAGGRSRTCPNDRTIEDIEPGLTVKGLNSMNCLPRDLCRQEFGEKIIVIGL